MPQIKRSGQQLLHTCAMIVAILLAAGACAYVTGPEQSAPPSPREGTPESSKIPQAEVQTEAQTKAQAQIEDARTADPVTTVPSNPDGVPSYIEVVESEFYASGTTPLDGTDVLTESDLQLLFETRVEFDDPSHHGELYSDQPLATRSELEAVDRQLVASPSATGPRPPRPVIAQQATQPSNEWKGAALDKTLRDYDSSCLRSGCHQEYTRRPWVHSPVAVGGCESCHVPDQAAADEHRFQPTRSVERLCSECHKHPEKEKVEHAGYRDADCTLCHDPHGGSNSALLVSLDPVAMCKQCHDQKFSSAPGAVPELLHKPFAEGRCLDCHVAHRANHESLTILPAGELCLSCHEDFVGQFPEFLRLHEAVKTDCGSCHLPHGGSAHLIRSKSLDLCLGCHEKVANALEHGSQLHTALKEAKSCLDCHVPHASYTKNLLKGRVGRKCVTCHDKVIEMDSGRDIQNIKELLVTAKYRHAPAIEGQCQECHVSHSLENQRLLFAQYPTAFYVEGSRDTYRLCLKCHDEGMLLEEETVATRFRDGTRNLHRLHVLRKKGRTCNICHEVHAADVPKLMKTRIPFGASSYMIEIGFQETDTGGGCGPNCHHATTYNNTTPAGAESLMRYQIERD